MRTRLRTQNSNLALCLREFLWASPSETLSAKGLYLTVYPLSRPNTDIVLVMGPYCTEISKILGLLEIELNPYLLVEYFVSF